MKRLTRKNLNEQAEQMLIISEINQRSFIGGGDGIQNFPYTIEKYENMVIHGTWKGGFVDSGGYISQDVTSIASGTIINNFRDFDWNFYWSDGVGIKASCTVGGYAMIKNGELTVYVNLAYPSIDMTANGYAALTVNGVVVKTRNLILPNSSLRSLFKFNLLNMKNNNI